MVAHAVKYDHDNGEPITPVFWCGRTRKAYEWYFSDIGHMALSVGGSQQPCKDCIKAVIAELKKEL